MGSGNDRGRLRLLLASSSVAALLIGGGSSAAAACYAAASPFTNSGPQTCISVANTSFSGNVINSSSGIITAGAAAPSKTGILINNSTITGAIVNHGTIAATAAASGSGIHVFNNALVTGGITNTNAISAGGNGIFVGSDANASGNGAGASIAMSNFSGGIGNTGTISTGSNGIFFGGNANAFGTGASAAVTVSNFSGGISNASTISAGGNGIFVGGEANASGSGAHASITISTFSGSIANGGQILAAGNGIFVGDGGYYSTGASGSVAISTFAGGVSNSGTISAGGSFGIKVTSVGTFGTSSAGGISNGGTVSANDTAIYVSFVSTFVGGITNNGTILAGSLGIWVNTVSIFGGGITNSGTISATIWGGIQVNSVSTFAGGINNSSKISAGTDGIFVAGVSTFAGGISNSLSGAITANTDGIYVAAVSIFSNGITNAGSISAGSKGIVVGGATSAVFAPIAALSSFGGGITNSGRISANSNGIYVTSVSTFSGDINNSGTISAGGTGIRVLNVSTFLGGGIINTGTIIGSVGIAVTNSGAVSVFDSGLIDGTSGIAVDLSQTGPGNTFTLGPGYTIVGNVVGSGSDTFQLGGTGSGSFDLSSFGGTQQYQGFATLGVIGGSWTLLGTNTSAIPFSVTNGTATVNGSLDASTVTVNSGGTLTFSGAGVLSDVSGTTTVNTGGTLDLGGTTQTQATVNLAGGTIQNGGLNGAVNSTGGTINGLGGTASVTATAGTTIVEGINGYTGATVIAGGTFDVIGTITDTSGVDVEAGGVLTGTGKVDPPTTNIGDNATLVAGNAGAPGTSMTIPGSLSFASGALYVVYLNTTTSTFTTITGSAALNGTVQANFAPGTYGARQYTILTATGGVTGTFAALTPVNFTGTVSLSYDADDAFLNVGPGYVVLPLPAGANVNQRAVVTGVNNAITAGDTIQANIQTWDSLSGPAYLNALNQTDGEDSTGAEHGAFDLMNGFLGLMLDPFVDGRSSGRPGSAALGFAPDQQASAPSDIALAYAGVLKAPPQPSFDQRWSTWASAFGGSAATNGDPTTGSNNVTTSTYGYAGGADYRWSPDTVLGFSLAGGGTNWTLAQGLGSGRSDALLAGLYGVTHQGPAYLAAALAFANNWFTTNRSALGDQLTAGFQGQSYSARLEGGYRFAVPMYGHFFGVTPYGAIQAQDFRTPAYSETDLNGGGLGLSYSAMNGTETRSELGTRFDELTVLDHFPLLLRAKLAWAHDWVSNPSLNASFESLPGSSFTVNGAPMPRDSALTSAGAQLFFTSKWSLLAKFDGEFAPGAQTYAGSGTLRYTW